MQINDILKGQFTDAEYLAHQRDLHKERHCKALAWIMKDKDKVEVVDRLKEECEYSLQNLFCIPGSGGVRIHVGTPPRWKDSITDDEEGLWVFNRTHYFNELVKLYQLTDEKIYAEKVLSDMENWIDNCPLPKLPEEGTTRDELDAIRRVFSGLTPWRSLEVGIRMFDSWNVAYDHLLHSELMTPELHSKIAISFYEHGLVLRTMSPIFWPKANHNHYLHEMLGLFVIACIFPDFKEADAWREFAIHELGRCAKAQFTEDGAQVEGSPGYHHGCLSMFLNFIELARTFKLDVPDYILDICRKATDYDLAAIGSDGIITPFGDTGCSAIGSQLACRYYTAFGELGATAKIFAINPHVDPDIVPEEVQKSAREYAEKLGGEDNRQRQIDQYFARTGWTREDSQFGFLCHSPVFNGHSHQDPMTFTLYLNGDLIVVDPSCFTYRECPERRLFKSPEYHSTLTFNNKPAYEYVARWSFGPQKEGKIRGFYKLDGVFAADASHHGYDPDYHKRLCALVGKDVFLVADDVVNLTETDVRIYFHMDDPTVRIEGNTAKSDRIRVLLPEGVMAESVPSEKSTRTDITKPSSRIILTDKSHKSRLYLTLFTKRDDVTEPKIYRTSEGVEISYSQAGEEVKFLWAFSNSLKKI